MPPPLLEVRDVAKSFGGVRALNGVSFAIGEGELRCIIGPNGCGKTTLFNVITGAFPPSGGTIRFRGEEITGLRPHRIARLGIARKFQVPGIYPTLAAVENLEVPLAAAAGRSGPLALLRGGARPEPPVELLRRFGLAEDAGAPAGALAHGRKQWLEIAMLLAAQPRLLLLDEPTAGMTGPETAATADLVRRLRAESGVAILVIEHDMGFVQQLGCPVMVMMRGAVFREGSFEEVQRDPAVREAYFGQVDPC